VAIAGTAIALPPMPSFTHLALAVLLLVASDRCGLSVALGYSKFRVDWFEAAVVLGMVLLPAPWYVLVTLVCLTVMEAARKTRLLHGSFNVASTTSATALAGLVISAVGTDLTKPGAWLGLLLGALTYAAVSGLALQAVIAFSTGQRFRAVLATQLPPLIAAAALSIGLALAILAACQWGRLS